jgi:hypothetical protein
MSWRGVFRRRTPLTDEILRTSVLGHAEGVILSPQGKNLVVRNWMRRCAEMFRFAQHDTFAMSRYSG